MSNLYTNFIASRSEYFSLINYYSPIGNGSGIKVITTLPFTSGVNSPTLFVEGYDLSGANAAISLQLSWNVAGSSASFQQTNLQGYTLARPVVKLGAESGNIVVYMSGFSEVGTRLTVNAYGTGASNDVYSAYTGWSVVNANITGSGIVTPPYNDIYTVLTGFSGAGGGGGGGVTSINGISGVLTLASSGFITVATTAGNITLGITGLATTSQLNSLSGFTTGLSGYDASTYATIINLATTGSVLYSDIGTLTVQLTGLSGQANTNYATVTNLALTGSNLYKDITGMSGWAIATFTGGGGGGTTATPFSGVFNVTGSYSGKLETFLTFSGGWSGITYTLPSAASMYGQQITIKQVGSGQYIMTGAGGDQIFDVGLVLGKTVVSGIGQSLTLLATTGIFYLI